MLFQAQRGRGDSDHENWSILDVLDHYGWDGHMHSRRQWSKIRCPFHLDRTPSAGVSESLNSFRCFSCDRSGNSVTVVMKEERLDAGDAVEWLRMHIDQVESDGSETSDSQTAERSKRSRAPRIPWEPMTLRS